MIPKETIFTIIAQAGKAKSIIFEALSLARAGRFNDSEVKLNEATEVLQGIHKKQTDLMTKEAQGKDFEISLLLIHAQDHLMNAMLSRDLVKELIQSEKEIHSLKKSLNKRGDNIEL
ncbi:PTS lactose/cellobiose transporter subunit IIA [Orenia marismortui]|uniref:PTS lactose/cellobiose transporter subunit IIA n=1 Tax=Orenia marismortui TaxID=46469 RepID=UPI000376010F|nr:PTS lactose/cellobiose transporter subunit IIA [Orenia marismortui]